MVFRFYFGWSDSVILLTFLPGLGPPKTRTMISVFQSLTVKPEATVDCVLNIPSGTGLCCCHRDFFKTSSFAILQGGPSGEASQLRL